ncbi:hypothetical protein OIU84_010105 [Salix udensis]|uniref:Uncharacterized protein n=1 Tax=Salix udensis TaxID=889485 RepID=A0AAD6JK27_9ROSI|nr:hypothetical protein OIU84_010105 [Salix udensis]
MYIMSPSNICILYLPSLITVELQIKVAQISLFYLLPPHPLVCSPIATEIIEQSSSRTGAEAFSRAHSQQTSRMLMLSVLRVESFSRIGLLWWTGSPMKPRLWICRMFAVTRRIICIVPFQQHRIWHLSTAVELVSPTTCSYILNRGRKKENPLEQCGRVAIGRSKIQLLTLPYWTWNDQKAF